MSIRVVQERANAWKLTILAQMLRVWNALELVLARINLGLLEDVDQVLVLVCHRHLIVLHNDSRLQVSLVLLLVQLLLITLQLLLDFRVVPLLVEFQSEWWKYASLLLLEFKSCRYATSKKDS